MSQVLLQCEYAAFSGAGYYICERKWTSQKPNHHLAVMLFFLWICSLKQLQHFEGCKGFVVNLLLIFLLQPNPNAMDNSLIVAAVNFQMEFRCCSVRNIYCGYDYFAIKKEYCYQLGLLSTVSRTISCLFAMFIGGSPYPGINGREIANKLQQGYRMPKPQHVDHQLWVILLVFTLNVKLQSHISETIIHNWGALLFVQSWLVACLSQFQSRQLTNYGGDSVPGCSRRLTWNPEVAGLSSALTT